MADKIKKLFTITRFSDWFKGIFKKPKSDIYYNNSPSAIKDENGYVYEAYADALHEKIDVSNSAYNIGIIAPY